MMETTTDAPKTWSPVRMLELCYSASDVVRAMLNYEKDEGTIRNLTTLNQTLAQFTNETQHVWDEYVELLDHLSEVRDVLEGHSDNWLVRDLVSHYDHVIASWDKAG